MFWFENEGQAENRSSKILISCDYRIDENFIDGMAQRLLIFG